MGTLRMHLYQKTFSSFCDEEQKKMYNEVLSFESAMTFASADELIVEKTDGSVFRTAISHYESDPLTETYIGKMFGKTFRFLFASKANYITAREKLKANI